MTKTSKLAFLAGIIDGDGSISINIIRRDDWDGYSFQPNISIGMTSRKLCKWVQQHFGGNLYGYKPDIRQKVFHIRIYGKQSVTRILTDLLPYLLIKKQAAQTVLEYMALGDSHAQEARLALAEKAHRINAENHTTKDERSLNTRESYAYLAGIIESEGCIGIRDNSGQAFAAYIKINNTNESLIRWIEGLFNKGSIRHKKYAKDTCRDCYLWDLYGKQNIETVLLAILPYLIIKKELANTVLQFVRLPNTWNKEERLRLFHLSKVFNVRKATLTTNTLGCPESGHKIESDLMGNHECAPLMTATA